MSEVIYFLRDRNVSLVGAWTKIFADIPEVRPSHGDIFDLTADAIVSPANSFGFMDGGIDMVYTQRFGWGLQERLQKLLWDDYDGELPVGDAVCVPTDDPQIPLLLSAPTMTIPADVRGTLNAYLAFRAVLRLVKRINAETPGKIQTVLCPGLATATGQMPVGICARQMHFAYERVIGNQKIDTRKPSEIIEAHYRLLRGGD